MKIINTIKWWASIYKTRLVKSFKETDSLSGKWMVFCTLFNQSNLRIKRKTGFYFPFLIGVPTDELKDPYGIDLLKALEKRLNPLKIKPITQDFHLNIMIPTINPELIFGGYIGLYNFIDSLTNRGYRVRILVCEDLVPPLDKVIKKIGSDTVISKNLKRCEIIECLDKEKTYILGREDIFIGYSWMTMRLAHHASKALNGKLPIFFIQEFEPIFHHFDSLRFLADETYTFPHNAVFNSPQLARYFENKQIGVFSQDNPGCFCTFKHGISKIKRPTIKDLKKRKIKKVLIYARPERHAGRNLFEVSIMALKKAIENQTFPLSEWEFYGIGSLGSDAEKIYLTNDLTLKLLPKVSYSEYANSLSQYDIGISLMYAPHPSVPPLEMAAAGMLVVTTKFENRTALETAKISSNIISADHTISSITSSIKQAVIQTTDYQSRYTNSHLDWPTSWTESFNDDFNQDLDSLINET